MSVRAKFEVVGVTKRKGWDRQKPWLYDVKLQPVVGNSEENKKFYAATPGGAIEISTINEEAANYLEPGKQFYIDFTKAEENG